MYSFRGTLREIYQIESTILAREIECDILFISPKSVPLRNGELGCTQYVDFRGNFSTVNAPISYAMAFRLRSIIKDGEVDVKHVSIARWCTAYL